MKDGYELFEKVRELLGDKAMLDELEQALSSDELRENAEWIARMWDLDLEEDE